MENWWAKIKFSDGVTDVVSVKKIRHFKPINLNDYDKKKWYKVLSDKYSDDGKEHPYYALIGCLADNQDEILKSQKRVAFACVPAPGEDAATSNSELEKTPTVQTQRAVAALKKKDKARIHSDSFQKFIDCHMATSSTVSSDTTDSSEVNALKLQIEELKEQLKQKKQGETNNDFRSSASFEDFFASFQININSTIHSTIQETLEKQEAKLNKKIEQCVQKSVDSHMATMKTHVEGILTKKITEEMSEWTEKTSELLSESIPSKFERIRDWVNNIPKVEVGK